jgi:hypothetical protein
MTSLDDAHAAMMRDDADDAARLGFYSMLADTELFLLLEGEPVGDRIEPRLFELDEGPVVLAFDLEERLAAFVGGPTPYAALPGRVIAAQLSGQNVGMGLNIGDAPSSILLPYDIMDWLTKTLGVQPKRVSAVPQGFSFPWGVPPEITQRLMEKLGANAGLADAVLLSEVVYEGGRHGHILAVLGAKVGSEVALSGAVSEALIFSGLDIGEIDVVFLGGEDPRIKIISAAALRLDLPKVPATSKGASTVLGAGPLRPPILR